MADSKNADVSAQLDMGTVRKAMAFKVKYRVQQSDGTWKTRIAWDIGGAHPDNRYKTYPNGLRCRTLCGDILVMGFSLDEADHAGVVVEETPGGTTFNDYNKAKSHGDILLEKCFPASFALQFAFLSHNHLGFIVKAFRGGAQWDSPPVSLCGTMVPLCDAAGRLTLEHIAKHPNGEELAAVCGLGMLAEVLSYKITDEEPLACGIISRALNMKNEVCLGTTEMQALDCLTGEISLQMSRSLTQGVLFDSVRSAVADQLDMLSDDPDLVELFDLVISLGAGTAAFVDELKAWSNIFVDASKRRMRLVGFKSVNSIGPDKPRVKLAAIKLSYRSAPKNGFVNNPDPHWAKPNQDAELDCLEESLRYMHDTCKTSIDALASDYRRVQFLAIVDCTLAQTWLTNQKQPAAGKTAKEQSAAMRTCMAEAVSKLRVRLQKEITPPKLTGGESAIQIAAIELAEWNIWTHDPENANWLFNDCPEFGAAVAASSSAGVKDGSTSGSGGVKTDAPLRAQVLQFDPDDFTLLNSQTKTVATKAGPKTGHKVPVSWSTWLASNMDAGQSIVDEHRSLAYVAVRAIHRHKPEVPHNDMASQIAIQLDTKTSRFSVVALKDLQGKELNIPAWVSNIGKLTCKPEHGLDPNNVALYVKHHGNTVHGNASVEAVPGMQPIPEAKQHVVYMQSDCCLPKWKLDDKDCVELIFAESTRMHPFWVVERMTAEEVRKDSRDLRINCRFESSVCTDVCLGQLSQTSPGSNTNEILVPYVTNAELIRKGETLVLPKGIKPAKVTPAKTWKELTKKTTGHTGKQTVTENKNRPGKRKGGPDDIGDSPVPPQAAVRMAL